MNEEILYTVSEVANKLKLEAYQVRTLIKDGRLKAVNVGFGRKIPRWAITEEDLDIFMGKPAKKDPQPCKIATVKERISKNKKIALEISNLKNVLFDMAVRLEELESMINED